MPVILDIFNNKAFKVVELTNTINRIPFVPSRLRPLFTFKGVHTTQVALERRGQTISLIPTKSRGSGNTTKRPHDKRDMIPVLIPHIPYDDTLWADDLMGVRQFGTENTLETVTSKTNDILAGLRRDHELTHEFHRIGALQGHVKDADGTSTILNLFTLFNITETVVDFNLDAPGTDVKLVSTSVTRAMEQALGGTPFSGIRAQVGNAFWDALISHPSVVAAFDRWQEGRFLREDQRGQAGGFTFAGITYENYRGKVGDVDFIPTDVARFYPEGVPDLFLHYGAPADFVETVNTVGLPIYVKQEKMKWDKGIEFHSQSNPLIIATKPEVLIKGVRT
jgi:Phage major capsid protein E